MKAALVLTACAALTVCAGCGPADGAPVKTVFDPCSAVVLVPDTKATPADLKSIDEAAAMWNALVGSAYGVVPVDAAPRVPVRFQAAAQSFHGFYDDDKGVVFVNSAIADDHERAVVIAHELGHSLGLLHVPPEERASVMNPDNTKTEPNEGDKAALVRLWGECTPASDGSDSAR